MGEDARTNILERPSYACVRCGVSTDLAGLESTPSPRCPSCGFTVFGKVRSEAAKQVAAL